MSLGGRGERPSVRAATSRLIHRVRLAHSRVSRPSHLSTAVATRLPFEPTTGWSVEVENRLAPPSLSVNHSCPSDRTRKVYSSPSPSDDNPSASPRRTVSTPPAVPS